ncbi:ABC transporter substrate-binding protein [Hyphomicrobium methylovorum]|uniref:ABC transporter substrate-binding protein n=1 Tax=Hyphomicrobium methylovorum TaxID=84 RepID=UPI0015E6AD70|nr:ABC transporter substrate-binding protein [Hyphomicrobium methylovorum]MBA2127083.1 ABC transporter substrate-binding protein [Hyphomicrobium methylovorum]
MATKPRSAVSAALGVAMRDFGIGSATVLKIGFLAPLTGPLRSWAAPGLYGSLIWIDRVNAAGGLKVGSRRYMLELVPYDTEYNSEFSARGARKLIREDGVKFLMMIGGNDVTLEVRSVINRHRMLVATLLPSDLSPDAPTLIAPSEVHPIYNVTGVDWLKRNAPKLKTVSLCAQRDLLGLPSIATYRAAFEAAGIKIVAEQLFEPDTTDFGGIVEAMMAPDPDILCWDTAYEPFVHELTIEAYKRNFRGRFLSCTCDNYPELIRRTSPEFMEGFVFQFPDFDDPRLDDGRINFEEPRLFYDEYCRRFPGTWSAVSWEYAATLELWKAGVQRARSFEPFSVLAAMKLGGIGSHAFGEATWWGTDLFGIDNALVGDWPVVAIENGRARIQEFCSIPDWWSKNGDVLVKHLRALDLMWDQREQLAAVPVAGNKLTPQDS